MTVGAVRPLAPGVTVKVRLSGTGRGCAEAARRLHRLFYVTSVSQPYPGAGSSRLVTVYIKVRLDLRPPPPPAPAPGEGSAKSEIGTEVRPTPGGEL